MRHPWHALLFVAAITEASCTGHGSAAGTGNTLIDYCISSRWGFSCFTPQRRRVMLDLSGGRGAAALVAARTACARGALVVAGVVLSRWTFEELHELFKQDPGLVASKLGVWQAFKTPAPLKPPRGSRGSRRQPHAKARRAVRRA